VASKLRRFLGGDLQVMMAGNAAESAMRFGAFVERRKNSATRLCWSIGIGGLAMTP